MEINEADHGFQITDLGSSNGTWIEGRRLAHNKSEIFDQSISIRLGPGTNIELVPDE